MIVVDTASVELIIAVPEVIGLMVSVVIEGWLVGKGCIEVCSPEVGSAVMMEPVVEGSSVVEAVCVTDTLRLTVVTLSDELGSLTVTVKTTEVGKPLGSADVDESCEEAGVVGAGDISAKADSLPVTVDNVAVDDCDPVLPTLGVAEEVEKGLLAAGVSTEVDAPMPPDAEACVELGWLLVVGTDSWAVSGRLVMLSDEVPVEDTERSAGTPLATDSDDSVELTIGAWTASDCDGCVELMAEAWVASGCSD